MATVCGVKRSSPIDDDNIDNSSITHHDNKVSIKRFKPNGNEQWIKGKSEKHGREYWYIDGQPESSRWCNEWDPVKGWYHLDNNNDENIIIPNHPTFSNLLNEIIDDGDDNTNDDNTNNIEHKITEESVEKRLDKFYKKKENLQRKIRDEECQLLEKAIFDLDEKTWKIKTEYDNVILFANELRTQLENLK